MASVETPEGARSRICQLFSRSSASVRGARQFVMTSLPQIPTVTLENIEMMVSELASNCILHGATSFEVCVVRADGRLRIEVTDFGEGTPVRLDIDTERLGGRGLLIVGRLADDWGVDYLTTRSGKTVWFTVDPAA
jgi:anti-sigma regulatory factor (Ser/Thr protein kinase)